MATPDESQQAAPASVASANAEQARAWNGEEGDDWATYEEQYSASARRHGRRMLDAARIAPGERVLDLGCGCGESTRAAARAAGDGLALGVDLSAQMIARARERARAEGLANARFEQADAQVYAFDAQAFDLAISRFGAMFFGDPVAAFQNVGRALRPGGRLALVAWQELDANEWLVALRGVLAAGRTLPTPPAGAPGPFGLADAARTRQTLAAAGYTAVDLEALAEPVYLGADAADAFAFVRSLGITRGLLGDLDEAARARALDAVQATLAAHDTGQGVLLGSAAWLITARRA